MISENIHTLNAIHKEKVSKNIAIKAVNQAGFSLVELMVGLVIGLLATLAIMQVYSAFEGQKRSTTGSSDAQTNGSVGLYSVQRDVQLAGYGLPLYDESSMPLKCNTTSFDHDANAATPNLVMIPITITDGATATASDTITVRYGSNNSGGVAQKVLNVLGGNIVELNNNLNCANDPNNDSVPKQNVVFSNSGPADCKATLIDDTNANMAANPTKIKVLDITGIGQNSNLACLGMWSQITFDVFNNQLRRNGVVIIDNIVNIQAQYGISASPNSGAGDNKINQWIDATGAWAAPGNTALNCNAASANRNCIKAIRVAIVARNGLLERTVVTNAALTSWIATSANPPVASPAPIIDLTNTANWDQYRYRVYESIMPLRNIVWTRSRL